MTQYASANRADLLWTQSTPKRTVSFTGRRKLIIGQLHYRTCSMTESDV